jgi:drug/metabolite transporter (DMT)-like permease
VIEGRQGGILRQNLNEKTQTKLREARILLPVAIVVAIVAVSTASIFIRYAQRDVPSLTIAAWRLVLATVLLTPIALVRHHRRLAELTPTERWLAALSGLFLAIHFASWITSLEYTTVASSVVLVSTGPLWVALASPIFLGEHPTRLTYAGLGLAIAGGATIALGEACTWSGAVHCPNLQETLHGRAMYGNILALVGAWAVSGYIIIGRRLRRALDLVPYVWLAYGFAAIALSIAMLLAKQKPFGFAPAAYLWLILLAVVPQLIGHSTYNWALGFLSAALVATLTLGEPVGSAILAYALLGERPGLATLVGGGLVLAGIYLAARGPRSSTGPDVT